MWSGFAIGCSSGDKGDLFRGITVWKYVNNAVEGSPIELLAPGVNVPPTQRDKYARVTFYNVPAGGLPLPAGTPTAALYELDERVTSSADTSYIEGGIVESKVRVATRTKEVEYTDDAAVHKLKNLWQGTDGLRITMYAVTGQALLGSAAHPCIIQLSIH